MKKSTPQNLPKLKSDCYKIRLKVLLFSADFFGGNMNRREMREQALVLLFEKEFFADKPAADIEAVYEENMQELSDYARSAFENTLSNTDKIDPIIEKYSTSRKIHRIPKINLSILRLALYEIIFEENVPESVAVNEAVELAKKYSGKDDYAFINGILGSYLREK